MKEPSANNRSCFGAQEDDDYEYLNGYPRSDNYRPFGFINNTKPKLSINGEKMKRLVNKLFGPMENEHA
jgi:hypothetical protein